MAGLVIDDGIKESDYGYVLCVSGPRKSLLWSCAVVVAEAAVDPGVRVYCLAVSCRVSLLMARHHSRVTSHPFVCVRPDAFLDAQRLLLQQKYETVEALTVVQYLVYTPL